MCSVFSVLFYFSGLTSPLQGGLVGCRHKYDYNLQFNEDIMCALIFAAAKLPTHKISGSKSASNISRRTNPQSKKVSKMIEPGHLPTKLPSLNTLVRHTTPIPPIETVMRSPQTLYTPPQGAGSKSTLSLDSVLIVWSCLFGRIDKQEVATLYNVNFYFSIVFMCV